MKKGEHSFLSPQTVEEASRILKAISDPTRMKILYLLFQEECSVGHMVEVLGVSQSAISHQLTHLRHLRLVKYRREGNTYFYTYDDEHVVEILHQVIQHVECAHNE
jgi:DNA-binding transcriptional ArsR family regulator